MNDPVVFIDTETTGLDPERHSIWEVGLIDYAGTEHQWLLSLTAEQMQAADPIALSTGRFHERHPQGNAYAWHDDDGPSYGLLTDPEHAITEVLRLTHGLHLAGAVVSFDEERLRLLALDHGMRPSWHYHLIEVEALAAGFLMGRRNYADQVKAHLKSVVLPTNYAEIVETATPPWDSSSLSKAVGVDPDDFDRHTALGDARWAKAIYEAVMHHPSTTDKGE